MEDSQGCVVDHSPSAEGTRQQFTSVADAQLVAQNEIK